MQRRDDKMIKIDRNRSQVPHKKETALFVIKLFFSGASVPSVANSEGFKSSLGGGEGC